MRRQTRGAPWQRTAVVLLAAVLLVGCASGKLRQLRWPFQARALPAPEVVDELVFESRPETAVSAFPQYFRRNTLIIDLSAAGAAGTVTLRPKTRFGWPVRVAFRVRPGAFAVLEVRGQQRLLLPVTAGGQRRTIDLELPPGFVAARSAQAIEVRWGAVAAPADGGSAEPAAAAAQSAPTG